MRRLDLHPWYSLTPAASVQKPFLLKADGHDVVDEADELGEVEKS